MNYLTISKTHILNALQSIISVVEKRNSLPILLNVLIEKTNDKVVFTTSDIELQISSSVRLQSTENLSKLTVSARKLLDIVKLLNDGQINFSLRDNKLFINQDRSKYSLHTLPSEDFPLVSVNEDTKTILKISSVSLKSVLDSVSFSMAIQDVRYFLNGLYLELTPTSLVAVTTDGHRLSYNAVRTEVETIIDASFEGKFSCIIPRKAITEIQKLLSDKDELVEIDFYKNHLQINTDKHTFISRLIEGNYPDYSRVIPDESKIDILIKRVDILSKLQRVQILTSDKYRGIKIQLEKEKIILKVVNSEQEEAQEEIICENEDQLDIGFNVIYLIDVLANMKTEDICISLIDSQSSAVIKIPNNDDYKYIVMPMRI
ncbi:MAG: DNA polymerase III subunit beta [Betaproteobacteria bacterium TMED82]|nr:MAG: DNA polymerase III subunit beta [Betaproteobacteria bacterium TMED82]